MDYKTYCDTVIRNYIEDNAESLGFDPSNVVMPDNYVQIIPGEEKTEETIVYDVDYTKPYYSIKAVYNNDLVINIGKIYIQFFNITDMQSKVFVNGTQATRIPIQDDYIGIILRLL